MGTTTQPKAELKSFINYDYLRSIMNQSPPTEERVKEILDEARNLKGLPLESVAELLNIEDEAHIQMLLDTACYVKEEIYGKRLVLFAPLYVGNKCSNECLYCAFRKTNTGLKRVTLDMEEISKETELLLEEGHKRVLLLTGEAASYNIDYIEKTIETIYAAEKDGQSIRRINVEIAPMDTEDFARLKECKIGTYTCFQETYDPTLYKDYHPSGPKSDYLYRLTVMDRAMEAGIDDVGIGVLYGLADYRFETLAMMDHARHLEEKFGCGPHTVSVPRIEPAKGAPLTENVPMPVSDKEFRKIVASLRIALPYTGIILSTREQPELRRELFHYGVSQISAGSRTNPGGYSHEEENNSQFSLGDHRSMEEIISELIDDGYVPSFCTGCYRKGRVGNDFMDLAKPGLIKEFCLPNGLFSFAEYLLDFAAEDTQKKGFNLIKKLTDQIPNEAIRETVEESMKQVLDGKRDLYL